MNKRRKWMRWLAIVVLIFAFLAATALVLVPASADERPFSWKIRSKLSADYRYGETTASLGVFRVSIIGDVLRDIGMQDKAASQRENVIELVMEADVPTATAFDFEGNPPQTATSTATQFPTSTPTQTATPEPTNTRLPSSTPSKTPTKITAVTAVPIVDSDPPVIADPGTISPSPGPYASCSLNVSVTNARIKDPPVSSGINWVKLKYKVYDDAGATLYAGYVFSSPLSKCSGGSTAAGGWDACYTGPSSGFTVSIYPGFSTKPDYTGPGPFMVKLWLITEDNKGNSASHYYGDYRLPNTCDDPPPPTSTPLPTDSTMPSIVTMDVSPPSGSILTTCDLTVNTLQILDPSYSEGVSASGVEVKNELSAGGYFYQPLGGFTGNFVSGPGSDWTGSASGTVTVTGINAGDSFDFYGAVTDNAGNGPVYSASFDYTMAAGVSCP